jgi:hypothetical protein
MDVIFNYVDSDDDHEASISFRKDVRPSNSLLSIKVTTEEIGGMIFWLDYDASFEETMKEMREHFEYLDEE